MGLVYTHNSSGAIKAASKRKPEKAPSGKLIFQRGRFRVIGVSSGFNVQRRTAPNTWVNVCFKARQDAAIAELKKQEAGGS